MTSRREFIQKSLLAGIGVSVLGKSILQAASSSQVNLLLLEGKYTLPPLPYDYAALEPWIDTKTMQIHHDKHHQAYVDNLNKALEEEKKNENVTPTPQATVAPPPDQASSDASTWADLEERFRNISKAPAAIRNHGGGHWNHSFFWEIMRPVPNGQTSNAPTGKLMDDITRTFGGFDQFKDQFGKAAKDRFGSGWAWLVHKEGTLVISSTPNQDNPLMDVAEVQGRPILGIDVWEHAYYLKYQNVRGDYVTNWWNLVNWDKVNEHYTKGM